MTEQVTQPDQHAEDEKIHPGIRSHVTGDAEFRAHVQRGRESARVGSSRSFEAVDHEIRRLLAR